MTEKALQDRYGSNHVCFGCGPANPKGLRIKSFPVDEDTTTICDWQPEDHHHAFAGMLSGGIVGTLLDCHSNWTTAWHLMTKAGESSPPCTVTAEFAVKLLRPCPTDEPVHLVARIVESSEDRATVEATLEADGKLRATCRGVFVAVQPGHPAYRRW